MKIDETKQHRNVVWLECTSKTVADKCRRLLVGSRNKLLSSACVLQLLYAPILLFYLESVHRLDDANRVSLHLFHAFGKQILPTFFSLFLNSTFGVSTVTNIVKITRSSPPYHVKTAGARMRSVSFLIVVPDALQLLPYLVLSYSPLLALP